MGRVLGLWLAGCAAAPGDDGAAPRVAPTLEIGAPWSVAHQADDAVALRFADTPHGVWIARGGDGPPGVSPIVDGRRVGAPLVAIAAPDAPLAALTVRTEGHDAVIRFSGPPLSTLTAVGGAPEDPVLTWVRVRPRDGSWRVVLDGLGTVALPAEVVAPGGDALVRVDGPEGAFALTTTAPAWRSSWDGATFRLDPGPSLHRREPYPRTALTWWPRVSP